MTKIVNSLLSIILIFLIMIFIYQNFGKKNSLVQIPLENNSKEELFLDKNAGNEIDEQTIELEKTSNITKEKIEEIIRHYITNNPEVIIKSLSKLHAEKALKNQNDNSNFINDNINELENSSSPPFLGNPNGEIKLIIFFDYTCSYCKKADQYLEQLIAKNNNVKVILRPIAILGKESQHLIKIALSSYKVSEDKFPLIHKDLISLDNYSDENIENILKKHDIDIDIINNEIDSSMVQKMMQKNRALAQQLNIRGAPSYIIGNKFMAGMLDLNKLEMIVKHIESKIKIDNNQEVGTDSADINSKNTNELNNNKTTTTSKKNKENTISIKQIEAENYKGSNENENNKIKK
ncbi:MAG TPA: DsbA family protein [Candidatus Megaira endosymbiont of Hartmannula sinica]|nr:DsbA family protein [Candidatus Megaera endosymbiont of Hartmannula sinica]